MASWVGVMSGWAVRRLILATGTLGMNFPLRHRLRTRINLCEDREEKMPVEMRLTRE